MKDAYAVSQRVLGALLCGVGVAMVVATLAAGGGPLALGFVIGVLFAALGAARLWLATRALGGPPADGPEGR